MAQPAGTAGPTPVHEHVVRHPEGVVQDAPEAASVQAVHGAPGRRRRVPHQPVVEPDQALHLGSVDCVDQCESVI